MTRQLCSWTGAPCGCTAFPFKVDGLIPVSCQSRIDYGMIAVRDVHPVLKTLRREMDAAMRNKTFDPKDDAQVIMWEQKLTAAKASVQLASDHSDAAYAKLLAGVAFAMIDQDKSKRD